MTGAVLAGLVAIAAISRPWGPRGAAALALVSVLWLLVNGHGMEGHVLLRITDTHGLTEGDLAGFTGLGIAAWRYWRWRNGWR